MVGHPQWLYLSNASEVSCVVVIGQIFKIVTNEPKPNHRVVADLANAACGRFMAESACALTLAAAAADPDVLVHPDFGAGRADAPLPDMGMIEPRHFAGAAEFATGGLDKVVAPVCMAGDEGRPPRLGQEQGPTRNNSRDTGIQDPNRHRIGLREQHPFTAEQEKDPKRDRNRGNLTKHSRQIRLPHGQSMLEDCILLGMRTSETMSVCHESGAAHVWKTLE